MQRFWSLFIAAAALALMPSLSSAQIFGPPRSIVHFNASFYGPAYAGYYGSVFPGYGYNGWYYPNTRYPNIGFEGYGPPSPPPIPPPIATNPPGNPDPLSAERRDRAVLNVRIPAQDAEVWIEGVKTRQLGMQREFLSPVLDPENRYSYQIKARWREDGREVTRTKTVSIRPNAPTVVDFTTPDR